MAGAATVVPAVACPLVVADSWFRDSGSLAHVANAEHGTLVVEARTSYAFQLSKGRRVKGRDLLTRDDWAWHDSAELPGSRYVRLTANSPTYGRVTPVMVDKPGQDRFYLRRQETSISAPCLIGAWRRRSRAGGRCARRRGAPRASPRRGRR